MKTIQLINYVGTGKISIYFLNLTHLKKKFKLQEKKLPSYSSEFDNQPRRGWCHTPYLLACQSVAAVRCRYVIGSIELIRRTSLVMSSS